MLSVSSASRARAARALVACAALLVVLTGAWSGGEAHHGAPEPAVDGHASRWPRGLLFGLAGSARAQTPEAPFTMEPGVVLSPALRSTVAQLAVAYRAAAGRTFHVTSGARTPLEQAEAMFDKLASGGTLTGLYRDYEAAHQLEQAYRNARRSGRARCVAAMTRVLVAQIGRGLYISRHLHSGAVDIRSRDMSARDRRTFRAVVGRQRGVRLLEEGRPPHFHLEFPLNDR